LSGTNLAFNSLLKCCANGILQNIIRFRQISILKYFNNYFYHSNHTLMEKLHSIFSSQSTLFKKEFRIAVSAFGPYYVEWLNLISHGRVSTKTEKLLLLETYRVGGEGWDALQQKAQRYFSGSGLIYETSASLYSAVLER
jgi:hypothetical protein